jgi:hypothetical protein
MRRSHSEKDGVMLIILFFLIREVSGVLILTLLFIPSLLLLLLFLPAELVVYCDFGCKCSWLHIYPCALALRNTNTSCCRATILAVIQMHL